MLNEHRPPCETAIELRVKQGILETELKGIKDILETNLKEIKEEIKNLKPVAFKMNIVWGAVVAVAASVLTLAFTFIKGAF
jgi:hypothetical protein